MGVGRYGDAIYSAVYTDGLQMEVLLCGSLRL